MVRIQKSVKSITEHRNIDSEVLRHKGSGLRGVVLLIAAAILGLALVFKSRRLNPDALADGDEVIAQRLEPPDKVDQHLTVQINQVIRLQFDRGIEMVLVRAGGIELVAEESLKIAVADQMGPLALEVVVRADLQIPGVADKGELEEAVEDLARQHFVGSNDLGMTGDLAGDAVTRQAADAAADKLGDKVGITPTQSVEGRADAGAGGLGDMDKEEVVAVADEHVNSDQRDHQKAGPNVLWSSAKSCREP